MSQVTHFVHKSVFPGQFFFGAATAAHQVQGSRGSNWDVWERSAGRKKELEDSGELEKHGYENFIAGDGCRFEEDFADYFRLAKNFGHNAIRFSINWATVEPEEGVFDEAILERYVQMVDFARAIGLEPVITLYHWTHPGWFEESGGWARSDSVQNFERFVVKVMSRLKARVKWFTVLNEPNVYAHFSYRWGQWPPQIKDESIFENVVENLRSAHKVAYAVIKSVHQGAMVGIGQSCSWITSDDPDLALEQERWHTDDLDELKDHLDFIGVQVYMHSHYPKDGELKAGWEGHDVCSRHPVASDLNWGMCPASVYHVMKSLWERYHKPIMITEHGHADAELNDHRRCWYIYQSFLWIERALGEGIPLLGYLHWSLVDNFEWKHGYWPHFGLFEVDRETGHCAARLSATLFQELIEAGGTNVQVAERYVDTDVHSNAAAQG